MQLYIIQQHISTGNSYKFTEKYSSPYDLINNKYTVKMNTLYLINKIVATDYKQYY